MKQDFFIEFWWKPPWMMYKVSLNWSFGLSIVYWIHFASWLSLMNLLSVENIGINGAVVLEVPGQDRYMDLNFVLPDPLLQFHTCNNCRDWIAGTIKKIMSGLSVSASGSCAGIRASTARVLQFNIRAVGSTEVLEGKSRSSWNIYFNERRGNLHRWTQSCITLVLYSHQLGMSDLALCGTHRPHSQVVIAEAHVDLDNCSGARQKWSYSVFSSLHVWLINKRVCRL